MRIEFQIISDNDLVLESDCFDLTAINANLPNLEDQYLDVLAEELIDAVWNVTMNFKVGLENQERTLKGYLDATRQKRKERLKKS